ncbi:hypothetical protein [Janthinobacterium sp. RA13]|uniref:hypothetical protein n=1 Tax=Janthinobacterium sp. RA13 TaxID=1502762 RepID=UPI00056A59CD|nr:hypothetical protein [Janthinobacterium sp. RA13]
MSIAVAAVIRTPVCLRLLQAVLGLCALLAAWPLSGVWRSLPVPGQLVGGYALGLFAALLSAAGGVFLLALLRWRRKPQALDISPVGQLRLAVYLEHGGVPGSGAAGVAETAEPAEAAPGLRLLPGSTLWPSLLVLCLADAAGRRTEVLVQRGGSCAAFRPLAVACRAIAARNREE